MGMKVLILGGNSPRHYDWNRQLAAALSKAGHEPIIHDYMHWQTGGPLAAIESEIASAAAAMKSEPSYAIIAKSIGTVIAVLGVARGALHPKKCILLGVPHTGIAGDTADFLPSMATLPRTLFVQNEHDPYGSAEGLDALLERSCPPAYELAVVFGNTTHDYLDFAQMIAYLR